jgi:iron(III) transport system ATP-binding protein
VAGLTLDRVTKRFGADAAVDEVTMDVADGEFVAILGPSGCGKTTLLRLVAGFETTSGGRIALGDRMVSADGLHVPPEARRTGIVFQSYALWPHMSVAENVAYALKVQRVPAAERKARVAEALETVSLADYRDRRPALLSGGQRQRVALARCLAMRPDIVLLDEPLANLDAHLRRAMEEEFADFHRRTGATMIYITHDQAEAMALADRIAVMDQGRVLQLATPSTLYREPADETVARFVGAGMILDATAMGRPDAGRCRVAVDGREAVVRAAPTASGRLCVREQDLALAEPDAGMPGRIRRLTYQGGRFTAEVAMDRMSAVLRVQVPEPATVAEGDAVAVVIRDGWLLPAGEAPQARPAALSAS